MNPLTPDDIVIYQTHDDVQPALSFMGRFVSGVMIAPVEFHGNNPEEIRTRMTDWLLAERDKLAKREAALEYLRSPEAIAERNRKAAETRAAKKAAKS